MITAAKKHYRERLDGFYTTADPKRMWQGLQHITDDRTTTSTISPNNSLPDNLNTFYTFFKTSSYNTDTGALPPSPSPTISSDQLHKALKKINPYKAAGPDNIPGRALRPCANKLAGVLT